MGLLCPLSVCLIIQLSVRLLHFAFGDATCIPLIHSFEYPPLPKYKVSGTYMPQTCSKRAASLQHTVAASLLQTRFSYANYFSGALFWHTICAASLQRTIVAHCSGTQCAPQVCSTQLSRTVLVHNVRRKFAVHSCCALFCVPQVCGAQVPCTALFRPHPHPQFITPTPIFFFSSLPSGGV